MWSNMAGHAQMPKVLQNDESTVSQGCVGVWSWFFVYELTSVEERKMFRRRYQLGVVWHGRIKCCVIYRRDWWILSCLIIILIYCDAKHSVSFTGVHSFSSLFSINNKTFTAHRHNISSDELIYSYFFFLNANN